MGLADVTAQSVRAAIDEFDQLGRDAFLDKYGFGKSRRFFLVANGKRYDSKAVLGAAHGFVGPEIEPLTSSDFTGGDHGAARRLRNLGFTVDGGQVDQGAGESLGAVFQQVLELQHSWAASNTPEMQERGVLIRKTIPQLLAAEVADGSPFAIADLRFEGRDGTGKKTRIPWVRAYSEAASPRATGGWYAVYLFSLDGETVFLSLNQGTTDFTGGEFKAKDPLEIADRVAGAREKLSPRIAPRVDLLHDIALAGSDLGVGYASGNVVALQYSADAIPSDAQLADDLRFFLTLLGDLYTHEASGHWLFQANPEIWDLEGFLASATVGQDDTWLANQSRVHMRPADSVVLWLSGPQGGARALAKITGAPFERPRSDWNKSKGETEWAVPIRLTRILDPPLLRAELLEHPVLKDLKVLKFANATNFSVTPQQWEALMALLSDEPHPPSDPLLWLEHITLWPRPALDELLASVTDETPQIVLAGPPGTGKTWLALHLARYLTEEFDPDASARVRTVQFHPTYGYEEFVEGLRPTLGDGGGIGFARIDGAVLDFVGQMTGDAHRRVLIIDEMNRANLPRVFGELMFLLEYRDTPLDLMYSKQFTLPRRLLFIGTMNTADRSIRSIDAALRRRFDFFDVRPDVEILRRFYEDPSHHNAIGDGLYQGFEHLNADLTEALDRHHTIGHTFLMKDAFTSDRLMRVWDRQLAPLIEEYFFDQPDLAASFTLQKYWPTIAGA